MLRNARFRDLSDLRLGAPTHDGEECDIIFSNICPTTKLYLRATRVTGGQLMWVPREGTNESPLATRLDTLLRAWFDGTIARGELEQHAVEIICDELALKVATK